MRYKIKQQAFSIGFLPVNNDYLISGFLTSLHVAMLLRQASTSSSPSSPPSLQEAARGRYQDRLIVG
ncbi:hypothetical protein Pyn_22073 [Prunus yedoensis var. nudiflora]|uniref:Uncharacterized protein n=1 Tax=Prunus yedoensis var. nudiflora TaxID=2094558 RepID=A0A314Z1G6_PRUYE|nr:hypothetical protein Pyn_22073 [Prunus yedoensis var. nudiflora]